MGEVPDFPAVGGDEESEFTSDDEGGLCTLKNNATNAP